MDSILSLIDRDDELFTQDMLSFQSQVDLMVSKSSFLVIGGAGSIGQAVTRELFKRDPQKLHVVDINENNLVELVRDIRSSFGYIAGDFRTFALDIGTVEFDALINSGEGYDYFLNLSALKHVRSEKDPYTLMRMINTNIINTEKTMLQAIACGAKKYFCVSTDKAANPANLMGASKCIMEKYLMRTSLDIKVSTARFANVAFSDGSLLYSFNQRLSKRQPIVAPYDIKRYFVTPKESGVLCLMSCLLGENRDIFFPNSDTLNLITFSDIAVKYLKQHGYAPHLCASEEEARDLINSLPDSGKWPCLFTKSDTTGEKDFEEFYTNEELVDVNRFEEIGVIKNEPNFDSKLLDTFKAQIDSMRRAGTWDKKEIIKLIFQVIPDFDYLEKGKYLDGKM
ncbi:MAG: FlaA1/EpsC-like NDP-sugar epimerase [Desulforhopalus sp.]|jgi:FlaA1/EpsC-like NDP-sugar epimerase